MSDEDREDKDHLESLIAAYLEAESRGEEQDRQRLIAEHPELADSLRDFFANHDQMKRAFGTDEPTLASSSGGMNGEGPTLAPSGTVGNDPTLPPEAASSPNKARVTGQRVRYFGDYELLEEIARGGMGVVFKARQINLNRTVALKMILARQFAGHQDVLRFHTEAEAAAHLDHPGIVPIFEIGEHEGQHYFSMGYVEGQSLAQRVANGPLPPQEAAELVKKVADAMAYAHQHGVIHRDLKPANILIDRQGQPKVTDFGLAKRTEADSGLTGTGQVLGTPAYMPPEQASGRIDQVGPLADVYSLGAILYCLLTGRPPFQAASSMDTLLQVIEREPLSPRVLNPKIPLDLDTVCLKCLSKNPQKRYASATELFAELQRFLAGEPIHARPLGQVERTLRWCNRNRVTAGLITATSLSLIIGICVSLFLAYVARQSAREAERAGRRADKNANEARSQERIAKLRADEAIRAQHQAEQSKRSADAERLSVLSQQAMRENRPQRAMLLATEAVATTSRHGEPATLSARQNLQDVLQDVTGVPLAKHQAFQSIHNSPKYNWLAGLSSDGTAALYSTQSLYQTPSQPARLEPACENITTVAAGGRLLAVATTTGQIHLYQYVNSDLAKRTATFEGSGQPIARLILGNRQKYLLANTATHQLICWRLDDGQQVFSRDQRADIAGFSPDDRWLLTVTNNPNTYSYLALLNDMSRVEERPAYRLNTEADTFEAAVFSVNSQELVTSNGDDKLRLWDLQAESPLDSVTVIPADPGDSQHCLTLSSDNRWLSSVSSNRDARLWDLQKIRDARSANKRISDTEDVSVSLNVHCAIGLNYRSGLGVETYQPLAFSPNSKWLAAGAEDGNLHVWELDSIQIGTAATIPRQTVSGHASGVTAIQWDTNGDTVVTGSSDHTVRIWKHNEQSQSWTSTEHLGHESIVDKICIADGTGLIITHSDDGDVRKWSRDFERFGDAAGQLLAAPSSLAWALYSTVSKGFLIRSSNMETSVRFDSDFLPPRVKSLRGHELGNDRELVEMRSVARRQPGVPLPQTLAPPQFAISRTVRWLATSAGSSRYIAKELIGKVRVWDITLDDPGTYTELHAPFETPVTALFLSQTGRWLAAGSADGEIALYDRIDPRRPILHRLEIPESSAPIAQITITESNPWLICKSTSGRGAIWRLTPETLKKTGLRPEPFRTEPLGDDLLVRRKHSRGLCVVGRTEKWMATLHDDCRRLSFFDLRDEAPVQSMQSFDLPWAGNEARATLSDDELWLVVVNPQQTDGDNVCVFNLMSDRPIEFRRQWAIPGAIDGYVSDDHRWLIAIKMDSIALFPLTSPIESVRLTAKIEIATPGYAVDIAFHGPTQQLAAAFDGNPIQLWDLSSPPEHCGPVRLRETANEIYFIDKGKSLLSFTVASGELHSVRVNHVDFERLEQSALSYANRVLSEAERTEFRIAYDRPATPLPSLTTDQPPALPTNQTETPINSLLEATRSPNTSNLAPPNDSPKLSDRGPIPADIATSLGDVQGFAADNGAFALGVEASLFGALSESLKSHGYEIRSLRSYLLEGERKFAAAWERSSDQSEYRLGVLKDEIISAHQELMRQGYRAVDLGGYFESSRLDAAERFYGVWRKTTSTDVSSHAVQNIAVALTVHEVAKRFQELRLTHRPLTRQVYFTLSNDVRICDIWEPVADDKSWAVAHGSPQTIQEQIEKRTVVPVQYVDIATKFDGTQSLMAAVWRDRPNTVAVYHSAIGTMPQVAKDLLHQGYAPKSLCVSGTADQQTCTSVWTIPPAKQE